MDVYFSKKWFSLKLVRHELFHAYIASCCICSTNNIDSDDMEEICAEVYEFHADTLNRKVEEIWERLK
jgi:hypothetical protein